MGEPSYTSDISLRVALAVVTLNSTTGGMFTLSQSTLTGGVLCEISNQDDRLAE